MTPNSLWFKVSLKYYLHNSILSSKGTLFWWGRPPGHTHHLKHARRSISYVELCDLYICAHENWFPAQLGWPPLAPGLGPPRKWRRGLKIWTPSFLANWDPLEAKTAKKSTLAQKSYGSCLSDIPYHTMEDKYFDCIGWWKLDLMQI